MISYPFIDAVRELLDVGDEVRHIDRHGIMFIITDRKITMNAISAEITNFSLSHPLAALFTCDPTYVKYLASTCEMLWKKSIPAAERIRELLGQRPACIKSIRAMWDPFEPECSRIVCQPNTH